MDAEPETQDASEQVGSLFQRLPRLVRPFAIVSLLPLAEGLLLVAMFLMKSVMESLGW